MPCGLPTPMAQEAGSCCRNGDRSSYAPTKKEREAYVKSIERDIKTEIHPDTQKNVDVSGMVLVKLIDRQTGRSSYALVQEFRGRFSAFFWQE